MKYLTLFSSSEGKIHFAPRVLFIPPPRGKRKREDPGNKVGWFWLRFLVGKMMLCETSFSLKPITEKNKEIIEHKENQVKS